MSKRILLQNGKILLDSENKVLTTEEGSGGGTKLYMHSINISVPTSENGTTDFLFNIITNFNTQLTDNNFGELVFNYFTNNDYGIEILKEQVSITSYSHTNISMLINNGYYPGSTAKYVGFTYRYYIVEGSDISGENISFDSQFNLDGTKSHENLHVTSDYVKEL